MIKLHTNFGVITLNLFEDKAPKTAPTSRNTSKAAITTALCFTA